jgi:hypothetical protein
VADFRVSRPVSFPLIPTPRGDDVDLRQVVGQQVHVRRDRETRRAVPKPKLYLLRVQAAAKEPRRTRMPEGVETTPRYAGPSRRRLEDAGMQIRGVQEPTARRRENQVTVLGVVGRLPAIPQVAGDVIAERDAASPVATLGSPKAAVPDATADIQAPLAEVEVSPLQCQRLGDPDARLDDHMDKQPDKQPPFRRDMEEQPLELRVGERLHRGHWEGDLILGLQSSAIGTLVERTTRYLLLLHLPRMNEHGDARREKNGPALAGHGAEAVRDAIAASIRTLPTQLRRSLAWDQGAEMAEHAQLRIDTGVEIYFCHPQSPWQRGTNENTNGLLRQYFPRGTDLSRHSPDELAAVALALNTRPRKTLGWRTPAEALNDHLLTSAAS